MEETTKQNSQTAPAPKAKPAKKHATKKVKAKATKKSTSTQVSKSGKFRSIHHLMDTLFRRNKNLTREAAEKIVRKEYPNNKRFIKNNHYAWYKTQFFTVKKFAKRV